jgi:protoporphyrinogen oxidase
VSGAVVVAGAGPAGLSAALALSRAGRPVVVVERETQVGGIARTVERGGYRFDVGGHRFFTRIPEVQALWDELLGPDMLVRRRRSRILFRGRYFDYPVTAGSALAGLGAREALRIVGSYARARLRPIRPERSLADWVVNRFGRRLFELFFRAYTEKVWGLGCEEIGAQWAAQRIRGLSLGAAALDVLRRGAGGHRSLVTEFHYPRLGPGMLWERMRDEVERRGGRFLLGHRLAEVRRGAAGIERVVVDGPGGTSELPTGHLVSTIPLRDLVRALAPAAPPAVAAAAEALRFRGFLQVALVLDGPEPFPDTWLYLHDPSVRAGRIQNFHAWSPELLPPGATTCLGLEYFCWAGDELWRRPDTELVAQAAEDLARLGFASGPVVDGHVVRVAEAYPVYDEGWVERLAVIRLGLEAIAGLVTCGRGGMHRYNNMDHSMLTGLLAARNVLGARHDLWAVNAADDYLEPPARPPPGPSPQL